MERKAVNLIATVDAQFIKSASKLSETPKNLEFPEIAIMGRSNVGKSSTINSLSNRKNLAKKSNTPGKTKLINYFNMSLKEEADQRKFILVDLPGIGYAKVSKTQKADWEKNLLQFIEKRSEISLFMYLIDSRHTQLDIDMGTLEYLESLGKEVWIIYTKIDKLKKNEFSKLKMKNRAKNSFFVSNIKKDGVELLRKAIFERIN
jgi:GTP-binding protein